MPTDSGRCTRRITPRRGRALAPLLGGDHDDGRQSDAGEGVLKNAMIR
jgi:hypothetical protein